MKYFIDVSDKRNKYLLDKMLKDNFDAENFDAENLDKIKKGDYLIFSPAKKFEDEFLKNLPNDINLVCGYLLENKLSILKEKNINHINLMIDEIFTIKNANLTCEGVLNLMISETDESLYESNVLILGGGRIARGMAIMLRNLGVKFSIVSFNEVKFPQYYLYTNSCYYKKSFLKDLKNFNIIINTIPLQFLDKEDLSYFSDNSVLIETASIKCLDENDERKFRYVLAPALPARFCSKTAGELMFDVITHKNDYKENIYE